MDRDNAAAAQAWCCLRARAAGEGRVVTRRRVSRFKKNGRPFAASPKTFGGKRESISRITISTRGPFDAQRRRLVHVRACRLA